MKYSREDVKDTVSASGSAAFVYSTPFYVFALDGNFRLIEKLRTASPENSIELLFRNEWLPEEREIVKKLSGRAIVFLGLKNEKLPDVAFSQDSKKLELASPAALFGLAESRDLFIDFSKKAVASSVTDDNLIVQTSSSISELEKAMSLIVKRLREWYELYCPEASKLVPEHEEFIAEILSSTKADLIKKLKVKNTMGAELEKKDVDSILSFAATVKGLYDKRKELSAYLEILMRKHCPNLAALAGASTGAELLVHAGSLQRLAMLPSSTIQLLGAEQALFKHLKDKKERPPKFGVIHGNPLVSAAPRNRQGRVAKLLADKISIAVRVDFFKGEFIADRLLKEVEERLEK